MWRKLRIAVLLFILATVAHRAWLKERDLAWTRSLQVAVYPINADGSHVATRYIRQLEQSQFDEIADYFSAQAASYAVNLRKPFDIYLGHVVTASPPPLPRQRSALQTVLWSLKFRWWAWRNSPALPVHPDIRLYLLYHDPALYQVLPHSTALSKGRIGMVNVFAGAGHDGSNAVVIAHELLHTVNASDKYDLSNNQPFYPEGVAEPEKQPLYPQDYAELMGGSIALDPHKAAMPEDLSQTLLGRRTAQELRWISN